jgi:hypothetical protein
MTAEAETRVIAVRLADGLHARHIPLRIAHSYWRPSTEMSESMEPIERLRERVIEEMARAEMMYGLVR